MTAPTPRPGILDITPYKGGESAAEGVRLIRKLSSNESPLGASPKAIAAFNAMAATLHRYPDGNSTALRHAIGRRHGLDPERIICGNGSDDLIALLAQGYAGQGDEVIYSRHGFLMYPISTMANGATPVAAAETNLTANVDAMLAKVTPRTKMVFLANPNNPTGSYLPAAEVKRLRDGLPAHVLLVVDAAYAEYVSRNDYTPGIELVDAGENTVMTRTFSKIYGLAALRVGWAYAPAAVIAVLNRIRGAFNVNAVAHAAAIAALGDVAHVDAARTHNDIWLPKLSRELTALGLTAAPSVGNFILIRFGAAPKDAAAADAFLAKRGVLLRAMGAYGLPDCLRATIGTEEENRAIVDGLKAFLA